MDATKVTILPQVVLTQSLVFKVCSFESLELQTTLQGKVGKPHFNNKNFTCPNWALPVKISTEKSVPLLREYIYFKIIELDDLLQLKHFMIL